MVSEVIKRELAKAVVCFPRMEDMIHWVDSWYGIGEEEFIELTNSDAFKELVEKYAYTYVTLPSIGRLKRAQARMAVRGNLKAEEALLGGTRGKSGIHLEESRSLELSGDEAGSLLRGLVVGRDE